MFLQRSSIQPTYCEARYINDALWIKGFGNESEELTYACSDSLKPLLKIFELARAGQLDLDEPLTPETRSLEGMPKLEALTEDQVADRQAWIAACRSE